MLRAPRLATAEKRSGRTRFNEQQPTGHRFALELELLAQLGELGAGGGAGGSDHQLVIAVACGEQIAAAVELGAGQLLAENRLQLL